MIRDYNDETDRPLIGKWWEARGSALPAPELLPMTGKVYDDLAAGFLYLSDSCVAWMSWLVTNPDAPVRAKSEALDEVIDALLEVAKSENVLTVFTVSGHNGLGRRYEKHGFIKAETGKSEYFLEVE